MLDINELDKARLERRAMFQRVQLALAAYVDAKNRTKVAYNAMQSAWEERRKVRDEYGKMVELVKEGHNLSDALKAKKVNYEQVKKCHQAAVLGYNSIKSERDFLKTEYEALQIEYKRLKDRFLCIREHAKSNSENPLKKS